MVEAAARSDAGSAPAPRTAAWLHNGYGDSVWIVEADDAAPQVDRARIDFRYMLPNGAELTEPANSNWLETVKAYAWHVRESSRCTTAKRQDGLVRNLMHIVAWTMMRGRSSFAELLPSDLAALPKEAAYGAPVMLRYAERMADHLRVRESLGQPLPTRTDSYGNVMIDQNRLCRDAHLGRRATMFCGDLVHNAALAAGIKPASPQAPKRLERRPRNWVMIADLIVPLHHLYELRLHSQVDAPLFPPFPQGCAKLARTYGAPIGRTPTPPAEQYMLLLDRSLRWVAGHGPHILDALQAHRDGAPHAPPEELIKAPGSPWPLAGSRLDNAESIDLETAVSFLAVACYVVIGTFSARRKAEILRLRRDCVRGSSETGYWLRSYISKTLREEDETPCPACVGLAVQILERLSDDDRLFRWTTPFGAKRMLGPNRQLRRFTKFLDLPAQENGRRWTFATHQFRRMFAILYVWRWHFGDLESLGHHLRHFDLRMTTRYLTTEDLAALDEEQRRLTYLVAMDVATGSRAVGGKAGVRLKQMMTRLRKSVQVHSVERLPKLIERLVDRSQVVIKTNPWSYCLCPDTREAAARANCRQVTSSPSSSGPDLTEARPETCMGCTFNMTDARFSPFMEREIHRTNLVLASSPPPMLRHALERRLEQLHRYASEIQSAKPI